MNNILLGITAVIILSSAMVALKMYPAFRPYIIYPVNVSRYDLFINIVGMWSFLFFSSLLEDTIVHTDTSPIFTMFFVRTVSLAVCAFIIKYTFTRPTHAGLFAIPSMMNILASISQNNALLLVSFPEFALSKTLRLVAVAIYGSKGKERALWCVVTCIAGHFLFMYEFNRTDWSMPSTIGIVWLLIFILSDSFTSITQEEIFKRFQIENITMMYYINLFMCASLLPQIIFEGPAFPIPNFILMLTLSFCCMVTQFFTLRIIKQHGAIMFVALCVIRSVLTIFVAKYVIDGYVNYTESIEIGVFFFFVWLVFKKKSESQPCTLPPTIPKAIVSV